MVHELVPIHVVVGAVKVVVVAGPEVEVAGAKVNDCRNVRPELVSNSLLVQLEMLALLSDDL